MQDLSGQGHEAQVAELSTLVALSYFYRASSTSVADHKAVFSIRMLEGLIEAGVEGFLLRKFA